MHAKQDERASVREARQQRRYGRLAALLFGAGSLATLPAGLLLEPVPGTELLIGTLMGMASAVACWFIPWERLPSWSLDVVTAAGTLEVLVVCHLIDETYRLLYPDRCVCGAGPTHPRTRGDPARAGVRGSGRADPPR